MPIVTEPEPVAALAIVEKPKRVKTKVDPKLIAAARELRDRYLEQVNASSIPVLVGKYDVTRAIEATPSNRMKRLAAA